MLSMNNFFFLSWLYTVLASSNFLGEKTKCLFTVYYTCLIVQSLFKYYRYIFFFVFNAKVYLVRVLVLVFILDYESYPEKNNFRAQIYRSEIFLVNIKAIKSSSR